MPKKLKFYMFMNKDVVSVELPLSKYYYMKWNGLNLNAKNTGNFNAVLKYI